MASRSQPRRSRPGKHWREARRLVYESGFRWASDVCVDPPIPPERDVIVLGLDPIEERTVEVLDPGSWWRAWLEGWAAGVASRLAREFPDPYDVEG